MRAGLIGTARALRGRPAAIAGLATCLLLAAIALAAPWVAPHDPAAQYRDALLAPPVWAGGDWRFPLGTDDLGRDVASRLVWGARVSLAVGLASIALALVPGVLLGLVAAFFPGWPATVIGRTVDLLVAVPGLLLAIAVVAVLGPGLANTTLAIALVLLPPFVRLVRASAIAEQAKEYVVASRLAGASRARLMFDTVLPNCAAPVIVQATLGFSTAVLEAAALGFLGLGAQPPTPEWGTMLSSSRDYIERASWLVTLPGLAILVTVLAINLFGDGLRDALDPRLKDHG
ncbi:MAG: ABC transporter permease subunit [Burkholderiaceae bacterium]|nr:ABC transporter permease subunit [Burkholderiaceae bacterium]